MVLKEDLPAMKDTAGRAGLHVRSSKDYLLCDQLDYLCAPPVLGLHLQDMECSDADVRSTRPIQELIAPAVITCAVCVRHLSQVGPDDIRGMFVTSD